MNTELTNDGNIYLPQAMINLDQLVPGQQFKVERLDKNKYLLTQCTTPFEQNVADPVHQMEQSDLIKWLQGCPVKNWFIPMESELTSDIM
jgi:hypothetical protein